MSKKLIGIVASFALVLSLVGANTASALTAGDIAMLQAAGIISASQAATLNASLTPSASVAVSSGYSFAKDLTVGSKGADVTALQNMLGVSPATGYFGSLTKAALIKFQLSKGITPAAGYFGPKTRSVANASGSVSSNPSNPTGPVATGTDLSVSLAASSPLASALIAGQSAADLAEFTFSNRSAAPAVVTNVSLQRMGVSADTSLTNVYLYNGAVRLTDSASVSSGKITFNAAGGIFTVPAGSSMTVSVRADIDSAANGQLVAVALTGVTASLPVSALYPVSGSSMSVFSSSDIARATSTLSAGTVSGGNITAGSLNQTVWSTSLALAGRAVYLKSLALKVIGSVPTNSLQNVKLYAAGIQVASAAGMDANGRVTFDLTSAPYKIDSSRTLEMRADVVNGSSRSFNVSLQNASDLQLVDSNYNVGITIAIPASQSSGTWNVSTGSVVVQLDPSLASGDVITGASNVALARYTMKAYGEDMKISYLNASSSMQLDNVALYANGVQIGSTQTIATAGAAKLYSIGSSLVIPAGQTVTVEIRGDIKYNGTNATTTGTHTITANLSGYASNAQGSYSQQLSTVPALAGIDGPVMTVKSAGVSFAANAAYSNQQMVPNSNNVKIGSYVLQTNSTEPVRITSLTVTLGGAAGALTNVSNLRTSENANDVKGSPTASNNFSVDFTLPANSSKTIDVFADLSTVSSGVASTTMALSGYGVNSNTTITQAAVTGQSINLGAGSLAVPTLKVGSGYSPVSQFVVGNTTFVTGVYNFLSSNGASTITELTFAASGTAANIVNVSVGAQSASMVSGSVTVPALNIIVPVSNAGLNVPVTISYPTVGQGGVTSNNTVGLRLTGMKYTSGNTQTSTTTLAVDTNLMTLVGSKPTVVFNDVSKVGTVSGTQEIARVTVSADAKGDVNLLTLPLSSQASGAGSATASTSLKVYANGALLTLGTDFTNGLGAVGTTTAATGTITFLNGGYPISAGQSVTFRIYSPVTINATTFDAVATSLGASSLFTWKDVVGNVSPTGALILNYPSVDISTLNY